MYFGLHRTNHLNISEKFFNSTPNYICGSTMLIILDYFSSHAKNILSQTLQLLGLKHHNRVAVGLLHCIPG